MKKKTCGIKVNMIVNSKRKNQIREFIDDSHASVVYEFINVVNSNLL